jgi:hypothetical protein
MRRQQRGDGVDDRHERRPEPLDHLSRNDRRDVLRGWRSWSSLRRHEVRAVDRSVGGEQDARRRSGLPSGRAVIGPPLSRGVKSENRRP